MPCRHKEVEVLLQKLEKQMSLAKLWSSVSPSDIALRSTTPFACDQMPFEHWLQFIFIPKMKEIVISNSKLPETIILMPMAEQCFYGEQHLSKVIQVIRQIDEKFEGGGNATRSYLSGRVFGSHK